ncbi:MAG: AAA family ATPase [Bacilli bacterium]
MAINKAKIFTITSVKGGTGKTITVLNLAGTFSKLKKRTLIIDLDLYSGNIAANLNIDDNNDIYKLVSDLSNNLFDYLENYITKYNEFIDVIAAPRDPRFASKINSKYLEIILARASMKYDVILIDTNHIIDEINLTAMDLSDNILYIINNDSMDLKNMKTMISIFKDMDKSNYKVILNESTKKTTKYFTKYDIKNIIKDNVDYTIPDVFYIKTIDHYILNGQILTLNKKIIANNKKAINNFVLIANALLKEKK